MLTKVACFHSKVLLSTQVFKGHSEVNPLKPNPNNKIRLCVTCVCPVPISPEPLDRI